MAKKKSKVDLKGLFDKAEKRAEKATGVGFFSLSEYERKWGVPGYIPTGLWDLDLMLMHDDNRTHYGIPRGRITEIHGSESSFKSTLCYRLAAETIARGGRVYWLTTEFDFNESYALKHIQEYGVDAKTADENFRPRPIQSVRDLFEAMKNLMRPLEEAADKIDAGGGDVLREFPEVLFIVDSVAALHSGSDHDKLDKGFDESKKVGATASEWHNFFKFMMYSMAKMGATLVLVNQLRADMSRSRSKWQPAHDNTIRYYASLRLSTWAHDYTPQSSHPTRSGQTYTFGREIYARVAKVRGDWCVEGETKIVYQHHHGFDYYQSAMNCLMMTGVADRNAKGTELTIEEEDGPLAELNGYYNVPELKQKLDENPEKLPEYMYEAMKRGPIALDDMRSKK